MSELLNSGPICAVALESGIRSSLCSPRHSTRRPASAVCWRQDHRLLPLGVLSTQPHSLSASSPFPLSSVTSSRFRPGRCRPAPVAIGVRIPPDPFCAPPGSTSISASHRACRVPRVMRRFNNGVRDLRLLPKIGHPLKGVSRKSNPDPPSALAIRREDRSLGFA